MKNVELLLDYDKAYSFIKNEGKEISLNYPREIKKLPIEEQTKILSNASKLKETCGGVSVDGILQVFERSDKTLFPYVSSFLKDTDKIQESDFVKYSLQNKEYLYKNLSRYFDEAIIAKQNSIQKHLLQWSKESELNVDEANKGLKDYLNKASFLESRILKLEIDSFKESLAEKDKRKIDKLNEFLYSNNTHYDVQNERKGPGFKSLPVSSAKDSNHAVYAGIQPGYAMEYRNDDKILESLKSGKSYEEAGLDYRLVADLKFLKDQGIKTIYSLAKYAPHRNDNMEDRNPELIKYLWEEKFSGTYITEIKKVNIGISDMNPPTEEQLKVIVEDVSQKIKEGEKTFIHCGMGYGRTGTVLTAVHMVDSQERDWWKALKFVREKYDYGAVEERSQWEVLKGFEAYLKNRDKEVQYSEIINKPDFKEAKQLLQKEPSESGKADKHSIKTEIPRGR